MIWCVSTLPTTPTPSFSRRRRPTFAAGSCYTFILFFFCLLYFILFTKKFFFFCTELQSPSVSDQLTEKVGGAYSPHWKFEPTGISVLRVFWTSLLKSFAGPCSFWRRVVIVQRSLAVVNVIELVWDDWFMQQSLWGTFTRCIIRSRMYFTSVRLFVHSRQTGTQSSFDELIIIIIIIIEINIIMMMMVLI